MLIPESDVLMVADRLGLPPEDAGHVADALDDLRLLGADGFVDQTFAETAARVKAARGGQLATPEILRRVEVRARVAVALAEMVSLRQALIAHDGPVH